MSYRYRGTRSPYFHWECATVSYVVAHEKSVALREVPAKDDEREQFRSQALNVALVCITAFNVDGDSFNRLPDSAGAVLFKCSTLVF